MPVQTPIRPSSSTTELVRFLLARLDEDASFVKRLTRGRAACESSAEPARLRAECEAKRQVIGTLQQQLVLRDQPFEKLIRHQAVHMLRALALPYADHAAYRKEWALSAPM